MSKLFDIYIEGFHAQGNWSGAEYVGFAKGETFAEACSNFYRTQTAEFSLYNADRNSFWGCRLFENLEEAQRTFG